MRATATVGYVHQMYITLFNDNIFRSEMEDGQRPLPDPNHALTEDKALWTSCYFGWLAGRHSVSHALKTYNAHRI